MDSKPAFTFNSSSWSGSGLFGSDQGPAPTIQRTSDGRRIRVKLPSSTHIVGISTISKNEKRQKLENARNQRPSSWSIHTSENDEDDDGDDSNLVGSESEELQSSDNERKKPRDDDFDNGEVLSDGDAEELDEQIPEEEVTALPPESKESCVPCGTPQKEARTDILPGAVAPVLDDKEGTTRTWSNGVEEGDTAGTKDKPSEAWNTSFEFPLPECPPLNLSDELLFNEVFKIQEIDQTYHVCRGLDEQQAQCTSKVPSSYSFGIRFLQMSLANGENIRESKGKALAMYSLCGKHTSQSENLAQEWIRLANLTKPARKYWMERQKSRSVDRTTWPKLCAEFAAAEVRRALVQDQVGQKGYMESEKVIDSLRKKVASLESQANVPSNDPPKSSLTEVPEKISALEQRVAILMSENTAFRVARESNEIEFEKERERAQRDLSDAKNLYKESQETAEALRKDIDSLQSYLDRAETKAITFKDSLDATQAALTKTENRRRELEVRLEERMALGTKTEDPPETKLEKYLRQELERSQRQSLQQQKDCEKMREERVRLQITNATLESQVRQIEVAKEELRRDSDKDRKEFKEKNLELLSQIKHIEGIKEELKRVFEREAKELNEKNAYLSSQLQNARAHFEQLKEVLPDMEKENKGEASKSKFSLRDIYRRPKNEPSRPQTTSSN
ncbi:hypothetical protein DPSP01_000130 [Paraphaeosphaeria sporulosa]|uniref:Uncharacterized protein n=1 Tax=Paraphaeosphaeria sporulosa TaxID=1460663 RepID=A0A177D196_9PLEO|nr:uncharacterized protein CC84DRAFT_1201807 [Paraphaeosphaeria sporulosa]OAG12942.1 hypothetical protein CC84DRAFT_1201807 [Paraphaeosphaeria sporulosa]